LQSPFFTASGGEADSLPLQSWRNRLTFVLHLMRLNFKCKTDDDGRCRLVGKSMPLSVRMAPEEMAMLSALHLDDAITPSDKIRRLVKWAYRQQQSRSDYAEALGVAEEHLAPTVRRLRQHEAEHHVHSDLLLQLLSWLPDMFALAGTALQSEAAREDSRKATLTLEDDVAERIFSLLLGVLKMGLTPTAHCYRGSHLTDRLPAVLDLCKLLNDARIAPGRKGHE
jgi:hypothetical protein